MPAGLVRFSGNRNLVPRIATGTFTGNGGAQTVSLNFQPDWVIVSRETDSGAVQQCVRGNWAGTGSNYFSSSAYSPAGVNGISDGIDSILANGFTMGGRINENNVNYRYIAFKAGG